MSKVIDALMSDESYGCEEYGFIPRKLVEDEDDEDAAESDWSRYQRYLRKEKGLPKARVIFDKIYPDGK